VEITYDLEYLLKIKETNMSEPWLEKPYDMNDYRKDMDIMEEIYLDKDIKHDMLKLMDKVDDLEQKIINLNTKFHWLVRFLLY
jgi:hypothetical protein